MHYRWVRMAGLVAIIAMLLATSSIASRIMAQEGDPWGEVVIEPGDPVRIGFAAGLSGAGIDVLGIDEQRGAELAVRDRPEVLGFPVELDVQDSLCSAEGGQTVANRFVSDETIVAIVGHMCSSSCVAAAPIYEDAHYTMVSPSCTAPVLTAGDYPAFTRVAWNDRVQGPAAAEFLWAQGVRSVATIHDGSPYGEGLVNAMAEAFEEMGGEVVAQEAINVGDTDMRPVLELIASAGPPDAIYFGGFIAEGAYLAMQRFDVGMGDVIFMGADGILSPEFVDAAGDAAEGAFASAANVAASGEAYDAMVEAYVEVYGEEPTAAFHAQAYDAVNVILNAIEEVGYVDDDGALHIGRQALRDAIKSTEGYEGLTGTITCDEFGDCASGAEIMFYQVVDGEFVPVEVTEDGEVVPVQPEEEEQPEEGAEEAEQGEAEGEGE